jgi:hypothetical protein
MQRTSSSLDIKKLQHGKQLITIFVLLFVCAIFWGAISIFNSQQTSVISPELQKSALPLNPTITESVLDELEKERTYSESELAEFTIYRMLRSEQDNSQVLLPLGKELPPAGTKPPQETPTASPSPSPSLRPSPSPMTTPPPSENILP